MRRIIEIPPPVSQENAHEYATPQQNQDAEQWIEKYSTDDEQKPQDKIILDCPFCQRRLRVPGNYQGKLTCPQCKKSFSKDSADATLQDYQTNGIRISDANSNPFMWVGIILVALFFFILVLDGNSISDSAFLAIFVLCFFPELWMLFALDKRIKEGKRLTAEEAIGRAVLVVMVGLLFILILFVGIVIFISKTLTMSTI